MRPAQSLFPNMHTLGTAHAAKRGMHSVSNHSPCLSKPSCMYARASSHAQSGLPFGRWGR